MTQSTIRDLFLQLNIELVVKIKFAIKDSYIKLVYFDSLQSDALLKEHKLYFDEIDAKERYKKHCKSRNIILDEEYLVDGESGRVRDNDNKVLYSYKSYTKSYIRNIICSVARELSKECNKPSLEINGDYYNRVYDIMRSKKDSSYRGYQEALLFYRMFDNTPKFTDTGFYGNYYRSFDSISVSFPVAMCQKTRDEVIKDIQSNITLLIRQAWEALKESLVFQKYEIPIDDIVMSSIMYTRDSCLIYTFIKDGDDK